MRISSIAKVWSGLALLAMAVGSQQPPRDATIKAADGVALKVTYYAAEKPGPGIVLLHMCNSQRGAWRNLAMQAAARGFHVLALDYRGYGESEGPRFDQITQQERQQIVEQKWPGDFDAALAYLASQSGVDKQRIGAAGGSCGVNNSVQLARRHPEVKTLVLLSGTTNAAGREYLKNSSWLPVFAAASLDDGAAVDLMRWLLAWSRNPNNKFLEYQNAGHGTDMFAVEKGLEPAILEWFDKNLRNAPLKPPAQSAAAGKPSVMEEFWIALNAPGASVRARQIYEETKKRHPSETLFLESVMNAFGYELMQNGDTKGAVEVLKLNALVYPLSANVYDSLSDGYLADGNNAEALRYAEKTLQAIPGDAKAPEQFKQQLREAAETKIRQLKGGNPQNPQPQSPPTANPYQPRGAPPPPIDEVFRMPVVHRLPGMEQAKVRRDIVYKSADSANGKVDLKLDVYAPASAKAGDRFPAVLLISGGGTEADGPDWRTAGVYISYGQLLAASGMVGINFTKRYSRQEPVGNAESDLADLIAYLRAHAAEFNVDPDRLAEWGFSGGGLLLAQALREGPSYIRGLVSFYGVMDAMPTLPEERRAQVRERRSPLELMRRNTGNIPPVFIGRAGYDSQPLNDTIDNFVKEALARNVLIEVLNHPTGRHGFDIIDNNDRSREIIAAALDFLKRRLK